MNGQVEQCFLCRRKESHLKMILCEDCVYKLCYCNGKTAEFNENREALTDHNGRENHSRAVDVLCKKHDLEKNTFYCLSCDVIVCHYCVILDHQEHTLFRREPSEMSMERVPSKFTDTVEGKSTTTLDLKEPNQNNQPTHCYQVTPLNCLDDIHRKNSRQQSDLQSAIDEVNQSIQIARDILNMGTRNKRNKKQERKIDPEAYSGVTMVAPDVIPTNKPVSMNHLDEFEHGSLRNFQDNPTGIEDDAINKSLSLIKMTSNQDDSIKRVIPEKFTISHSMSLGMQGELEEPVGVTTTADGSIFVADHAYDRLLVFDKHGQFVRTMTHVSTGSGRESAFLCPAGLATDNLGNLVIVERGRHRITVMSTDGKLQRKFGKMGKAHGHFRDPLGVSVDRRGRLIVADTANSRIQVFDKHGDFIFVFGHHGDNVLDYPNYAIYHQEWFIVSDTDNDTVKIFDKQGCYVRNLTADHEEGVFSAPSGLAVFKHHYVLVCDFNNDCVKMFTLDGQFVTKFGSEGSGQGQFSGPEAVSVTSDDQILVTDKNNSRVQIFDCCKAT